MDSPDLSNSVFTFASPRRQYFSIPENIVYYLTKNPTSSLGWKKLVKTCKYFYSKNQIIVADTLRQYKKYLVKPGLPIWKASLRLRTKVIDLKICPYKIWLINRLYIEYNDILISKIYRSDIKYLNITRQTISFEGLDFLTSCNTVEVVSLNNVIIKKYDGSMAEFDEILKLFSNVQYFVVKFHPENPILSEFVVNRINELPPFKKLKTLAFYYISEGFEIEAFTPFIKKYKHVLFHFHFSRNLTTSPNYIDRLQKYADNLITKGKNYDARILFSFPQLDEKKAKAIREMWYNSLNDNVKPPRSVEVKRRRIG